MMKQIVLASANKKKIEELKGLLPDCEVLSLKDIGFTATIEEPFLSFRENAFQKANTIYAYSQANVLADDSGICVEALDGAPGVHSARYAGEQANDGDNLQKLISAIRPFDNKKAYYKALLCLVWEGEAHYFEGECHGTLITDPRGQNGFGYDPIFIPEGYQQTFAELDPEVKKKISHRAKAMAALLSFINERG